MAGARLQEHPVLPVQQAEPAVFSDAELVEQAASGQRDAVATIWYRYHPMVRSVLLATLGPDQDVDDLIQEVFLGLFATVRHVRDGAALPAILSRIATRRAGMILRRRKVRSIMLLRPDTRLPEVAVRPPDLDDSMAVSALYRLIDRLKQRPRLAFLLHHVQGMDAVDVANALGVSLATAKRAILEGRNRIIQLARKEPRLFRFLPEETKAEP